MPTPMCAAEERKVERKKKSHHFIVRAVETQLTFDHTDIVSSVSNGEGHSILVLLYQVNHTFLQR